jgi:predicted SnoaL-like aldol condensation-catalyzing enzyme
MKRLLITLAVLTFAFSAFSQSDSIVKKSQEEINKQIALNFYRDLWQTNNTDKYSDYMAEEYVAHDIGDRKNSVEKAIEQKKIADMFWANGTMDMELDYQIAEGDLVANRWIWKYKPETFFGKVVFGSNPIPIINVFRFKDGKIVEVWNHRHDIDTNQTMVFTFKGLLIGLLIALIPTIWAFRLRKKLKKLKVAGS